MDSQRKPSSLVNDPAPAKVEFVENGGISLKTMDKAP
jgi:hypothetical protein